MPGTEESNTWQSEMTASLTGAHKGLQCTFLFIDLQWRTKHNLGHNLQYENAYVCSRSQLFVPTAIGRQSQRPQAQAYYIGPRTCTSIYT